MNEHDIKKLKRLNSQIEEFQQGMGTKKRPHWRTDPRTGKKFRAGQGTAKSEQLTTGRTAGTSAADGGAGATVGGQSGAGGGAGSTIANKGGVGQNILQLETGLAGMPVEGLGEQGIQELMDQIGSDPSAPKNDLRNPFAVDMVRQNFLMADEFQLNEYAKEIANKPNNVAKFFLMDALQTAMMNIYNERASMEEGEMAEGEIPEGEMIEGEIEEGEMAEGEIPEGEMARGDVASSQAREQVPSREDETQRQTTQPSEETEETQSSEETEETDEERLERVFGEGAHIGDEATGHDQNVIARDCGGGRHKHPDAWQGVCHPIDVNHRIFGSEQQYIDYNTIHGLEDELHDTLDLVGIATHSREDIEILEADISDLTADMLDRRDDARDDQALEFYTNRLNELGEMQELIDQYIGQGKWDVRKFDVYVTELNEDTDRKSFKSTLNDIYSTLRNDVIDPSLVSGALMRKIMISNLVLESLDRGDTEDVEFISGIFQEILDSYTEGLSEYAELTARETFFYSVQSGIESLSEETSNGADIASRMNVLFSAYYTVRDSAFDTQGSDLLSNLRDDLEKTIFEHVTLGNMSRWSGFKQAHIRRLGALLDKAVEKNDFDAFTGVMHDIYRHLDELYARTFGHRGTDINTYSAARDFMASEIEWSNFLRYTLEKQADFYDELGNIEYDDVYQKYLDDLEKWEGETGLSISEWQINNPELSRKVNIPAYTDREISNLGFGELREIAKMLGYKNKDLPNRQACVNAVRAGQALDAPGFKKINFVKSTAKRLRNTPRNNIRMVLIAAKLSNNSKYVAAMKEWAREERGMTGFELRESHIKQKREVETKTIPTPPEEPKGGREAHIIRRPYPEIVTVNAMRKEIQEKFPDWSKTQSLRANFGNAVTQQKAIQQAAILLNDRVNDALDASRKGGRTGSESGWDAAFKERMHQMMKDHFVIAWEDELQDVQSPDPMEVWKGDVRKDVKMRFFVVDKMTGTTIAASYGIAGQVGPHGKINFGYAATNPVYRGLGLTGHYIATVAQSLMVQKMAAVNAALESRGLDPVDSLNFNVISDTITMASGKLGLIGDFGDTIIAGERDWVNDRLDGLIDRYDLYDIVHDEYRNVMNDIYGEMLQLDTDTEVGKRVYETLEKRRHKLFTIMADIGKSQWIFNQRRGKKYANEYNNEIQRIVANYTGVARKLHKLGRGGGTAYLRQEAFNQLTDEEKFHVGLLADVAPLDKITRLIAKRHVEEWKEKFSSVEKKLREHEKAGDFESKEYKKLKKEWRKARKGLSKKQAKEVRKIRILRDVRDLLIRTGMTRHFGFTDEMWDYVTDEWKDEMDALLNDELEGKVMTGIEELTELKIYSKSQLAFLDNILDDINTIEPNDITDEWMRCTSCQRDLPAVLLINVHDPICGRCASVEYYANHYTDVPQHIIDYHDAVERKHGIEPPNTEEMNNIIEENVSAT